MSRRDNPKTPTNIGEQTPYQTPETAAHSSRVGSNDRAVSPTSAEENAPSSSRIGDPLQDTVLKREKKPLAL